MTRIRRYGHLIDLGSSTEIDAGRAVAAGASWGGYAIKWVPDVAHGGRLGTDSRLDYL
jgi:hypothetical protein